MRKDEKAVRKPKRQRSPRNSKGGMPKSQERGITNTK
jgi:hypothetical protein